MKSIIFNQEMMKAWLAGQKTVTRRPIKQALYGGGVAGAVHPAKIDGYIAWWPGDISAEDTKKLYDHGFLPPFLPGETIYIRETWWKEPPVITERMLRDGADTWPEIVYDADLDNCQREEWKEWGWSKKPSIHLSEKNAREFALIKSVRPERIREITTEEAIAEGKLNISNWHTPLGAVGNFHWLWESIYPGTWEKNVWVWRIELERKVKHDRSI